MVAIAQQLGELNDRTLTDPGQVKNIDSFLDRFRQVMRNQLAFRCLPLSMAHLVQRSPKMRVHLKRTRGKRMNELRSMLHDLSTSGELMELSPEEIDHLIGCISLISRGWLTETVAESLRPASRIEHYIGMVRMHLRPFIP